MNVTKINSGKFNLPAFKAKQKETLKEEENRKELRKEKCKKIALVMLGLASVGMTAIAIKNKGNICNFIKKEKDSLNNSDIVQETKKELFNKKTGALIGSGAIAAVGISAIKPDEQMEETEEIKPINHDNLGKAQKEHAKTLEEPMAKKIIEDAVALDDVDYIYLKEIFDDEYFRFHEMKKYKVDYGEEGKCSDTDAYHKAQGTAYLDDGIHNGIEIYANDKWFFKGSLETDDIKERIRANVKPEGALLEELDELLKNGTYINAKGKTVQLDKVTNFTYRTPVYAQDWAERQDPVTFFFDEEVNDETYEAIKNITERYARGTVTNALDDSPWLSSIEKNPSEEEISELVEKFRKYCPKIANNLEAKFQRQNGQLSSGSLAAHKKILEYFIEAQNNLEKKGTIQKRLDSIEEKDKNRFARFVKGNIDEDILKVYEDMSPSVLTALSDNFITATIVKDGLAESKTDLMKKLSGMEHKFTDYGIRRICAKEGGEKRLLYYVLDEYPDIDTAHVANSFVEDIKTGLENNKIKKENLSWLKKTARGE